MEKGIDFDELFSPVVNISSNRVVPLHGDMEKDINGAAWRFQSQGQGKHSLQAEEELIWVEASPETVV